MAKTYGNFTDFVDFSRASGGTTLRRVSYGAELVTNGTFDTDTSGWTDESGSTTVWSSGAANQSTTVSGQKAYQAITCGVGKVYQVSATFSNATARADIWVNSSVGAGTALALEKYVASGTMQGSFVATAETMYVQFGAGTTAPQSVTFDNISVKEVTFDQSSGDLVLFNHPNNIPRVEYDANGVVKGLLIEEARTNLIAGSDGYTGWNNGGSLSSTTSMIFLNGNYAAEYEVDSGATVYYAASVTASTTYTFSWFFKEGTATTRVYAFYDQTNGAFVGLKTEYGPEDAEYYGDGWYRMSATVTTPVGCTTLRVYPLRGQGESGSPAGVLGTTYISAAQLEKGSFPTSYIPTSGATATRAADIADIATANFGYNSKAGTLVVEFSHIGRPTSTNIGVIYGGATNARWVYSNTGSNNHYTYDGTTSITHGSVPVGQVSKLAVAVNSTTQQSSLDGASVVSASHNGNISQNTTVFNIGTNHVSSDVMSGHIRSIKYLPRRLTNTQLQEQTA